MKSERRHELQHNALADWLASTGKAINPHLNQIFLVGLVIVIAFLGYTWWSRTTNTEQSDSWNAYYLGLDTNDPKILAEVAKTYKGTTAASMATALVADSQLGNGCFEVFRSKEIGELALDKAELSYKSELLKAKSPLLLARAKFGLGRAMESQCELDDAERSYSEVVANWPDSAYAKMATERLNDLKRPEMRRFYDDFRSKFKTKSAFPEVPAIPEQPPAFDKSSIPKESSTELPGLKPEATALAEPKIPVPEPKIPVSEPKIPAPEPKK